MKNTPWEISLVLLLGLSGAAHASTSEPRCEPSRLRHAPPAVPKWDVESPFLTIYDWSESRGQVDLGIGHIRGVSDFWWGGQVRLPLHAAPEEEPWGWFADGWLVPAGIVNGAPRPIGLEGSVETEYEATSFIVFEERPDGWLRIRYGKPTDERDGTAWIHRCHLARDGLTYERWELRLSSDEISPLFFRDREPHVLRSGPEEGSDNIGRIDGDYHLEPLDFEGDWLKVRLKQPSDYCADPETVQIGEGWIRWRSAELGPLVWYYTRGC